ncbi:protein kinase subdomain-containing protein PKL/CAK/ChoK [Coprinopsis cinerea okayama7|uniref:Protein kinase subdomain-containing protein PKL/CAK/ChoK n=1 Tax=Coprinopsis cinerea (strain Okayama-7 / 130 / ATCC MYA-4618 / FGSC 9003) TaxID=240176 RepID=A8N0I2_COPC7|nr:protein kinase subdomain-containing protein PKL/CAK/ChoK [Coprinopsis cinerea okayama7\|eukprot:XP_001828432.2 protein kinase subdomain-containing protein PKL/CAK/ChoK [Coprinopsis cinerea okayama7\
MAPVMTPILSSSLKASEELTRQLSSSSVHRLADFITRSGSSSSIVQSPASSPEVLKEEGLPHVKKKLEPRHYKTPEFAVRLLKILSSLQVDQWSDTRVNPEDVNIRKISGALTNAVFFVSHKTNKRVPTLLLRIYGSSSGSLISRPRELHILHKLSSVYRIGPLLYGTFENGRIEQYFKSTTLTESDIREPTVSRWIGARMAEFHSVDIEVVSPPSDATPTGWELSVKKCVSSWMPAAHKVLSLPGVSHAVRQELDLARFEKEWSIYVQWAAKVQDKHSGSKVVFAHNDTQYGNLLKLEDSNEVADEHRQLIVVDFEYAGPNPAAYDIANHFHEWTANYHGDTPHLLNRARYPTFAERRNFYSAYIHHSNMLGEDPVYDKSEFEQLIAALDYQVRIWSPASHGMWAIWGIVQGREDVENGVEEPEFDYIGYAKGRMALFRQEIVDLGVIQR